LADEPPPWPNEFMAPFNEAGYRLWETDFGWFAERGAKLVMPGPVLARVRARLWHDQNGMCAYCEAKTDLRIFEDGDRAKGLNATIEHRQPLKRGGSWKRYNLCVTCSSCNELKGDATESEFRAVLAQFPPEPSGRWRAQVRIKIKNQNLDRQRAQSVAGEARSRARDRRRLRRRESFLAALATPALSS
jgi:hypothetical protein